jgi:hypothetical protein
MRGKTDLAVYGLGNASVTFPEGYSITCDGVTYRPGGTGGISEKIQLYGPIESTVVPQYVFWVPAAYKDDTDFDPSRQYAWCMYADVGDAAPHDLIYGTGASFTVSDWDTTAPTLTLSNGEESGGHPTMARPLVTTGDALAKASQLAGKLSTSGGTVTGQIDFGSESDSALRLGLVYDTENHRLQIVDNWNSNVAYLEVPLTADGSRVAFTSDVGSAISAIPYALVVKTILNNAVTLDDRASNAVTISTTLSPNTLTINFPTATTDKARDFSLLLNIAAGVTAPELTWPQGVTLENDGGEVPEIADGGTGGSSTILYFSEMENDGTTAKFLVKGETLTAITQA